MPCACLKIQLSSATCAAGEENLDQQASERLLREKILGSLEEEHESISMCLPLKTNLSLKRPRLNSHACLF